MELGILEWLAGLVIKWLTGFVEGKQAARAAAKVIANQTAAVTDSQAIRDQADKELEHAQQDTTTAVADATAHRDDAVRVRNDVEQAIDAANSRSDVR